MFVVIILIGIAVSEILYTAYKKIKREKPSGMTLFAILTPIIGAIASSIFYHADGWIALLKGFALLTIIAILIPLNFIAIKNGFSRTMNTTKSGITNFKGFFNEQKEKNDKFKQAWIKHKEETKSEETKNDDKKE